MVSSLPSPLKSESLACIIVLITSLSSSTFIYQRRMPQFQASLHSRTRFEIEAELIRKCLIAL